MAGPSFLVAVVNKLCYPQAEFDILLLLSITWVDVMSDILFVRLCRLNEELRSLFLPSLVFLVLPMVVNVGIIVLFYRRKSRKSLDFQHWAEQ